MKHWHTDFGLYGNIGRCSLQKIFLKSFCKWRSIPISQLETFQALLSFEVPEGVEAMWYVIQVMGGREENTADMIRKRISSETIEECFIPKKERLKKFKGRWQQIEEILFPGYVFAEAKDPEELYRQLKQITMMTKVLQDGEFHFLPLSEEEERQIKGMGDHSHITGLSKVRVEEGKQVAILEGPLKNMEGKIVKVDLHKREVIVNVLFMGRNVKLKLGIEMVE